MSTHPQKTVICQYENSLVYAEMTILGISAFYHDSAAALIEDGRIVAAAQEERFTRKKHDSGFPSNAVRFCLEYGGTTLNELDAIVFYDKPLLKFERLLETYYAFAPRGLRSFLTAMPVWMKDKLFLKRLIRDELKALGYNAKKPVKLLFPEHHLSHAASAFYPSAFEKAAILTIDGVGEWATASISLGEGKNITVLKELHFPHSLGLLYSAFTYFLGFRVNSGEYKLMGLAPYGDPHSPDIDRYVHLIKDKLVDIKEDGSIWLDQDYFDYATGLRMVHEKKWETLFGIPKRNPEDELKPEHCNLGLAIQRVTEDVVIQMAREARRLTNTENLVLAGGVALNCVANGKLQKSGVFKNVFIQPAAGDAGGALGAALAAYHIYFGQERVIDYQDDAMRGSYLGPTFSDLDVELMAKRYKGVYTQYDDFGTLSEDVARLLATENVVGWVQGRMEFGPRALGGRSILGDPRSAEMQKKLNLKIKYRESFRPFAPSVLAEDCHEYFDYEGISPYMLLVHPVLENRRKPLPANYDSLSLRDKLYYLRSDLPSITHIDFSARIQTVHQNTNPRYWQLIDAFKKLTGYGVIVNTSFNVRGEPIVNTPDDAYRCFMRTEMDYLVVGNYVFDKKKQPEWREKDNWKEEFVLD
jgi:carbamoyltransferase